MQDKELVIYHRKLVLKGFRNSYRVSTQPYYETYETLGSIFSKAVMELTEINQSHYIKSHLGKLLY